MRFGFLKIGTSVVWGERGPISGVDRIELFWYIMVSKSSHKGEFWHLLLYVTLEKLLCVDLKTCCLCRMMPSKAFRGS